MMHTSSNNEEERQQEGNNNTEIQDTVLRLVPTRNIMKSHHYHTIFVNTA